MFKNLFSKKPSTAAKSQEEEDPLQLAIAALLVEAARADETYAESEKMLIDQSLVAKFDLSSETAAALRAKAETAQSEALDIQRFTRIAKAMPDEDKVAFIEQLWEIVLSDGVRDAYEDTLMRRICGLIYVEDRISGEARARVAARLSSPPHQ